MPLPKSGEQFIDVALKRSKPGTILHLYAFLDDKEINKHAKMVKDRCAKLNYPVRIVRTVKCGQFSPGTYRVCFDLRVT